MSANYSNEAYRDKGGFYASAERWTRTGEPVHFMQADMGQCFQQQGSLFSAYPKDQFSSCFIP